MQFFLSGTGSVSFWTDQNPFLLSDKKTDREKGCGSAVLLMVSMYFYFQIYWNGHHIRTGKKWCQCGHCALHAAPGLTLHPPLSGPYCRPSPGFVTGEGPIRAQAMSQVRYQSELRLCHRWGTNQSLASPSHRWGTNQRRFSPGYVTGEEPIRAWLAQTMSQVRNQSETV